LSSLLFSFSDDPRRRKPDITKAKKYLNWEPKVELKEGLKATIADFRARLYKEKRLTEKLTKVHEAELKASSSSSNSSSSSK
jgi:dTDP-D-glucose 4,6-dehydratase